jgi:hypothetical protein
LNVSPTRAVSESTPSVITTETKVPDGTWKRFGGGGGAGSAFTSSEGGTGGAIVVEIGDGNVSDLGSFEALLPAGVALGAASAAGRGRDTGRLALSFADVCFAAVSRFAFGAAGAAFGSSTT